MNLATKLLIFSDGKTRPNVGWAAKPSMGFNVFGCGRFLLGFAAQPTLKARHDSKFMATPKSARIQKARDDEFLRYFLVNGITRRGGYSATVQIVAAAAPPV